MMLRPKELLLEVVLLTHVCCCLAAPLGKKERYLETIPFRKTAEELTSSASLNEPIRILRSTDRDVIIQILRPPFQQPASVDIKDEHGILEQSDEPSYNKHIKSKFRSVENREQIPIGNESVGKVIVRDRISRLSLQKVTSFLEKFKSKEFKLKDKVNDYLSEGKEYVNPFQERNGNSNAEILKNENKTNKGTNPGIELKAANDKDDGDEESYGDKGNEKFISSESTIEENKVNEEEVIDENFTENSGNAKEFRSKTSFLDGKNKRELLGSTLLRNKPTGKRIHLKSRPFQNEATLSLDDGSRQYSNDKNTNLKSNSEQTTKPLDNKYINISFKNNDIVATNYSEKKKVKIQEFNDGKNPLLFDHKVPLRDKKLQIRSPSLDSLQDLKRKFDTNRNRLSLLPKTTIPLRSQNEQDIPEYNPPNGQYYNFQSPSVVVMPTVDPVVAAERASTALQRMILFVNALGKFDYYVSNTAKNFVNLLTHHTHEYDETIRSRHSDKERCANKQDNDDDGKNHADTAYVNVRASRSRQYDSDCNSRRIAEGGQMPNLEYRDYANGF